MEIKPLDWAIWVILFTVFVFTTIKTEFKIKQSNQKNEEIVLSESVAVVADSVVQETVEVVEPVEITKPVVKVEPGMVVVPVGVSDEICTPETCPPPITYSKKTIFSRWRRR